MKYKIAHVCFFDVFPPKTGAGNVSWDFFSSIEYEKKLFQLSNNSKFNNKIININIFYNKPVFKILFLPIFFFTIFNYLKGKKEKIIIIEGASWIFYSYLLLIFAKLFNVKVIYRSHNIEYELRRSKSNILITKLTKKLEHMVFNLSNLSTSVSSLDQKKIKKLYKIDTYIFPNSLSFKKLSYKKNIKLDLPKKFIFFCGSYEYLPNKFAIDELYKKILPGIKKNNIYLVISGGGNIHYKDKFFINLGVVPSKKLYFLYKNCLALVAPLKSGFGTKLKVIEALCFGATVITSKKGIEGIDYKQKNLIITSDYNKIINSIKKLEKKKIKIKKSNFKKMYSVEKNTKELFLKINTI